MREQNRCAVGSVFFVPFYSHSPQFAERNVPADAVRQPISIEGRQHSSYVSARAILTTLTPRRQHDAGGVKISPLPVTENVETLYVGSSL